MRADGGGDLAHGGDKEAGDDELIGGETRKAKVQMTASGLRRGGVRRSSVSRTHRIEKKVAGRRRLSKPVRSLILETKLFLFLFLFLF